MRYSSLSLTKRGKVWYGVANYQLPNGEWATKQGSLRTESRAEAKRRLHEWAESLPEPTANANVGAIEYARAHYADLLALGVIERSTWDDYDKSLNAWVPYVGKKRLQSVTRDEIVDALMDMLASGRSPSTVNKRITALKCAYSHAIEVGDVKRTPFAGVRRPKLGKRPKNSLAGSELERVKQLLALSRPSWGRTAAMLALYGGLRRGECCALRWRDVEAPSRLLVRHAIGETGGSEYEKLPKSDITRDVPLCDALSDALLDWRGVSQGGQWVLCNGGGDRVRLSMVSRWWSQFVEYNGIVGVLGTPPTFHDLRHTFATRCVAAGMDVETLSSILGHASPSITLDVYATVDPSAKERAKGLIQGAI
jgi:integrase